MTDVRDLQGEDLPRLGAAVGGAAVRFLVGAAEVIAASGEGDVLVVGVDGTVSAAVAAGYDAPLGGVRSVTVRDRPDGHVLRRLFAALDVRASGWRCTEIVAAVDAADDPALRAFEGLGYVVSGAGAVTWAEEPGPGAVSRHADVWWVRRPVGTPDGGAVLLPGEEAAAPTAGDPPRTPVAPEERPCSSD